MFKKNFNRILAIVKKNIEILLRSKNSALIVIFGPLLIISLVGIAFNNSTIYDVKIGAYSEKYSDLSNFLIKQLEEGKFAIKKLSSEFECEEVVKKGDVNMCLVFSPDMVLKGDTTNKITFYVDYSRVNLVYAIMDSISSKLMESRSKISLEMTQILVDELEDTRVEILKKSSSINALGANNEKMMQDIQAFQQKLNGLNLGVKYEDFKLDQLNNARGALTGNVSDKQNMDVAVNDLTKAVNEFMTKMQNVIQFRDQSAQDLENLKNMLSSDEASVETLKVTLDKIMHGIESINVTSAESIVTPIRTSIKPVITTRTHLVNLFPTFLTLVIMFVGIVLGSTLVLNEKKTNAYFRNYITPTRDSIFLFSTYLTTFLIVFLQILIIVGIAIWFLDVNIIKTIINLLIPLFFIITLFILMGMMIGYLFNSQETSNLASLFVVSSGLLFSNTILPLESIPLFLKRFVEFNPFLISEGMVKKVILFGFDMVKIRQNIFELGVFVLILACTCYIALKYSKGKIGK